MAEETVARRSLDHRGLDWQGAPVARAQAPPELDTTLERGAMDAIAITR